MRREGWVVACAGLSGAILIGWLTVLASDPPDSKINPLSGYIQTTDSTWNGSDYDVRHVINPGLGNPLVVEVLTASSLDDVGPRVTIGPSGDTWVVWWRSGSQGQVLLRKRTYSTGTWDTERAVSNSGEDARHPEIVHDGSHPWVVYQAASQGGTAVEVREIIDAPEPVPPVAVLSTTPFSGDVNAVIHSEASHLWVTWVDSAANVGWCRYTYATGTWSAPSYESYATDSIAAARGRIRTTVLGS